MQEIVREQDKTLIMVSHDLEVAEYADRIVHMRDGQITEIEVKEPAREQALREAEAKRQQAKTAEPVLEIEAAKTN